MSESVQEWRARMDRIALTFACPYCLRPPGEWCETSSGRPAVFVHGQRSQLAIRADERKS